MSTKAETIRDPNSCLNRAEFDEPVFVLRANDPVAAFIVEKWADEYMRCKHIHNDHGALTEAQRQKYEDAVDVAARMRTWVHLRAQRK